MSHPVFVVIDIQNDYFPNGAMALHEPVKAGEKAKAALDYARAHDFPCIIVQHVALNPAATFFRPDTEGVKIHPDFVPQAGDIHLVKHYPNAFRETELDQKLAALNAHELVIVGMMTHMCIDTTTRAAADRGYQVTLLGDATATRELTYGEAQVPAESVQTAYLAALHGSFAEVVDTDAWMSRQTR